MYKDAGVSGGDKLRAIPYMAKHPDKTFIGRIEKGFDFLGYHFGPDGLSVAIDRQISPLKAMRPGPMAPHTGTAPGPAAVPETGVASNRWIAWRRRRHSAAEAGAVRALCAARAAASAWALATMALAASFTSNISSASCSASSTGIMEKSR